MFVYLIFKTNSVSGKLKTIFPAVTDHAKTLVNILYKAVELNKSVEARNMAMQYAMDSIGSCAFGIELNTMEGKNQDFTKKIDNVIVLDWRRVAANLVNNDLLRFLKFRAVKRDTESCFTNLVNYVKEYREKNCLQRNDIFQYVFSLTIPEEDRKNNQLPTKIKRITFAQMIGQLFSFFGAGFETSSILISFVLFELSQNPDVQNKLRDEIYSFYKIHGEISHENFKELQYLEKVIKGKLLGIESRKFEVHLQLFSFWMVRV